jgi:hypothetical protein
MRPYAVVTMPRPPVDAETIQNENQSDEHRQRDDHLLDDVRQAKVAKQPDDYGNHDGKHHERDEHSNHGRLRRLKVN